MKNTIKKLNESLTFVSDVEVHDCQIAELYVRFMSGTDQRIRKSAIRFVNAIVTMRCALAGLDGQVEFNDLSKVWFMGSKKENDSAIAIFKTLAAELS